MPDARRRSCSVIGADLLGALADDDATDEDRAGVLETIEAGEHLRVERWEAGAPTGPSAVAFELSFEGAEAGVLHDGVAMLTHHGGGSILRFQSVPQVQVCDAEGRRVPLPGAVRRVTGAPRTGDAAVDGAFEAIEVTIDFLATAMGRRSLDDRGMQVVASVRYGSKLDLAEWNGHQVVYGEGSGTVFEVGALTSSIDVTAHELFHGVIDATADLEYAHQPGAIAESYCDIFGVLVRRWRGGGADHWTFAPGVNGHKLRPGTGIRSLLAPGSAHCKDDQPDHVQGYRVMPNTRKGDHGGVHRYSGIPSRAFALAAEQLGGDPLEHLWPVWVDVLTGPDITRSVRFKEFRLLTADAAIARFGVSSAEAAAVEAGWRAVGL